MNERFDDAVMGISRGLLDELLVAHPDADETTTMLMLGGAVAGLVIDIIAGRHPSPVPLETVQDYRDFAESTAAFFRAASESIAQSVPDDDKEIH